MIRLTLLLALLGAASVAAQTAHVRVAADVSDPARGAGEVWVDGARAGAAGTWIGVEAGERAIQLVADSRQWDSARVSASVTLAPGDSADVALVLPVRIRVESLPIRAIIVRVEGGRRDTLGAAPLTFDADPGESVTLTASLDGYEAVRQTVAAGQTRATLVLPLSADTVPEAALLPTERSMVRRTLLDVGIAAAALTAGAVAVRYKFRADAADDRYRTEGSPDFGVEDVRQEALRLDRSSAIALGAMQVGVGVLALRFVLR